MISVIYTTKNLQDLPRTLILSCSRLFSYADVFFGFSPQFISGHLDGCRVPAKLFTIPNHQVTRFLRYCLGDSKNEVNAWRYSCSRQQQSRELGTDIRSSIAGLSARSKREGKLIRCVQKVNGEVGEQGLIHNVPRPSNNQSK